MITKAQNHDLKTKYSVLYFDFDPHKENHAKRKRGNCLAIVKHVLSIAIAIAIIEKSP